MMNDFAEDPYQREMGMVLELTYYSCARVGPITFSPRPPCPYYPPFLHAATENKSKAAQSARSTATQRCGLFKAPDATSSGPRLGNTPGDRATVGTPSLSQYRDGHQRHL